MIKLFFKTPVIFLFWCNNLIGQPLVERFFHPDSLGAIVEYLASDSLKGRYSGSEGCTQAAAFIAREFAKAGLAAADGNDGYFMRVTKTWKNVAGVIPGKSKTDELIIFSAHYDHIGTAKTNPRPDVGGHAKARRGDTIYNGANDNASGVSALISLAKYFAGRNNNERTLLFVAFAGEELGLKGSEYFAARIEPEAVKTVINIEMIGRPDGNSKAPYFTGSQESNLYLLLNKRLYATDPEKYKRHFILRDNFHEEKLFFRSDNYPFAQLGIPAYSFMATNPADKYYHSLADESSTLDYEFMSSIVEAIATSCEGLVNGEDTPSRIAK